MSGGPAVTPEGLVFGVNVANLRDGQLLSFLVPVKFVRDLLARAPRTAPEPKTLRATVERQLLATGLSSSITNPRTCGPALSLSMSFTP